MGCVILPFYLWNLIDRKSYEDFLLKGVSPLSRESRNEILRQRGAEPWFPSMWKKEIQERDFTYLWFKKNSTRSLKSSFAPHQWTKHDEWKKSQKSGKRPKHPGNLMMMHETQSFTGDLAWNLYCPNGLECKLYRRWSQRCPGSKTPGSIMRWTWKQVDSIESFWI